MAPLRFRKIWLAFGWGFIFLVVYLSLTSEPPSIDVPQGMKIGHVLAYCWLMLWFAQIYGRPFERAWIAGAFCMLGVMLEYLQGFTDYRNFEYTDMALDSAGVGLGLLLARTPLDRGLAWFESALARV